MSKSKTVFYFFPWKRSNNLKFLLSWISYLLKKDAQSICQHLHGSRNWLACLGNNLLFYWPKIKFHIRKDTQSSSGVGLGPYAFYQHPWSNHQCPYFAKHGTGFESSMHGSYSIPMWPKSWKWNPVALQCGLKFETSNHLVPSSCPPPLAAQTAPNCRLDTSLLPCHIWIWNP